MSAVGKHVCREASHATAGQHRHVPTTEIEIRVGGRTLARISPLNEGDRDLVAARMLSAAGSALEEVACTR